MPRTHVSTLALAAALAAGTVGGAFAQDAADDEAVVVEEAQAEDEAVVVEEEPTDDAVIVADPAEEAADATGDAVVVEQETQPAEGEAVIVEEAEPAEDEAIVVEEDPAVEEVEVEEAEVETPVEGQIFEQSPQEVLGSTLMDATVMSPDGDVVGDVDDVIVSADGQVTGVVIGVGGFLGIGEKRVALEFDQIQVQQGELGDLTFMTSVGEEQLENAPAFRTLAETEAAVVEPGETATGDGEAVVETEEPVVEGETVVIEEGEAAAD